MDFLNHKAGGMVFYKIFLLFQIIDIYCSLEKEITNSKDHLYSFNLGI
jgi:hypothetical protein